MKVSRVLSILWILVLPALAIDREAFTFTGYKLDLRVEPEQHRLGVRGHVTLRNDSAASQKTLVLQISSTLNWRNIQLDGKPVQFEEHELTSDIDHTGALSEAIVALPHEIPSKAIVQLDVGYEGVILLDATRLTRIGVPEDKAKHSDWDQISRGFTAVRGIGYVVWYPVATDAANLSDADSVREAVGRWKLKQTDAHMEVTLDPRDGAYFSGVLDTVSTMNDARSSFSMSGLNVSVPTFAIADYQKTSNKAVSVGYLSGEADAAETYADVASQIDPVLPVGGGSAALTILALLDPQAAPFVTQGMLLAPLNLPMTNETELNIAYAKARQLVWSPRAWIAEGLARYAQAAFIEAQKGRQSALDYLTAHATPLTESEKRGPTRPTENWDVQHSLINAPEDLYLQTKAMYVWWMLKDMLGGLPTEALTNYRREDNKEISYLQRLIEKQSHRDLQWFFDDWVYHDRGLPDFHVASVFSNPIDAGGFLVTITLENLGNAGAEVPLTLQYEAGEIRRRLEVRAHAKVSLRIQTPTPPQLVTVNDGSVPESDMGNNLYKVPATK